MAALIQLRAALLGWLLATAAVLLAFAAPALAQDAAAALQIKAAFLHKFATYVQGPGTAFDEPETPLVFGIAGSDSVFAFLTELVATQNADMRPAQVRRVANSDDLADIHVLFVGAEAGAESDALLQRAVESSILTVTDRAGPQPGNSMIHFFVADDRVRFDISLAPAEAAGLRLSSRLLQVARQVLEVEPRGPAPGP